jgi:hypothetical protein
VGKLKPLLECQLTASDIGELLALDAGIPIEVRNGCDEVLMRETTTGAVGNRSASGNQPDARKLLCDCGVCRQQEREGEDRAAEPVVRPRNHPGTISYPLFLPGWPCGDGR